MRDDQFQKLQQLEEKLIDVFLVEADPANWPGAGLKIGNMDAPTRGDLYWCRKTAASVLLLATRVQSLTNGAARSAGGGRGSPETPENGDDATAGQTAREEEQLDRDYDRAEKEAARLMRELQHSAAGTGRKLAFDRKTHGKA